MTDRFWNWNQIKRSITYPRSRARKEWKRTSEPLAIHRIHRFKEPFQTRCNAVSFPRKASFSASLWTELFQYWNLFGLKLSVSTHWLFLFFSRSKIIWDDQDPHIWTFKISTLTVISRFNQEVDRIANHRTKDKSGMHYSAWLRM